MLRTLIAFSLLSLSAHASHLDTVCKSSMQNPPLFADGIVSRTTPDRRHVIESLEGNLIFESNQPINSIVATQDRIWVLTWGELRELSKEGTLIKSHAVTMNISMTLVGDMMLIVRSGGIVSGLNTKSGTIIWTNYMQEVPGGEARAITTDGTQAYVAMATAYEGGFTGITMMNPADGKVIKSLSYLVRRYGVIGIDVSARWHDNSLVLNNGGWIHVISQKQLQGTKDLKPRWVAYMVARETDPHYMMLDGEFMFENNVLLGCGRYRERKPDRDFDMKSALFRVEMPQNN